MALDREVCENSVSGEQENSSAETVGNPGESHSRMIVAER